MMMLIIQRTQAQKGAMKMTKHVKRTTFLLPFVVFVLLITGWLGYISYLTKARNRACLVFTPENQRDSSSPISIELQDVINNHSSQNGDVGLQVTVISSDDVFWNGVAGYADPGNRCPMTLQHHLYIGSMTKPFTATLVMEQVESGSLSLDDTVNSWIHLVPENNLTVRHLLTHTSGLPDYARNTWFQIRWFGLPDKTWQPDKLVRVIQGEPLRSPLGSRCWVIRQTCVDLTETLTSALLGLFAAKLPSYPLRRDCFVAIPQLFITQFVKVL